MGHSAGRSMERPSLLPLADAPALSPLPAGYMLNVVAHRPERYGGRPGERAGCTRQLRRLDSGRAAGMVGRPYSRNALVTGRAKGVRCQRTYACSVEARGFTPLSPRFSDGRERSASTSSRRSTSCRRSGRG